MDFLKFYEEINFDIGKRSASYFRAKQGDNMSRGFFVRVVQGGQVLDIATVTMKAQFILPDRNKLEVLAKKVSGKFRVDVPAEAMELAGSVAGELELYGSGGELITDDRFTIHVSESIRMDNSNTGGVAPTEFQLLETRVTKLERDIQEGGGSVDLTPIQNELDKKANKKQAEWITPTLLSGWSHRFPTYPAGYMKDEFGFVHLRGTLSKGSGEIAFVLPEGYRPSSEINAIGSGHRSTSDVTAVKVYENGNVRSIGGVTCSVDGVYFYIGVN